MAVIHRANKKLRKEVVIPFDGEHNFIVPKYVNAAGNMPSVMDEPLVPTAPSAGTYTSTSTSTPTKTPVISPTLSTPAPAVLTSEPTAPTIAVPTMTPVEYAQGEVTPIRTTGIGGGGRAPLAPPINEPNQPTPNSGVEIYSQSNYFPVKNYSSMSCDSLRSYLNELNNVDIAGFGGMYASKAQGDYNALLTAVRNATDTACRVIAPAPIIKEEDIVIFPDISSMDCAALTAEIKRLQETIGLSATQKAQYDGQITNVQNKFTSKLCGIAGGGTTPTQVTSTTTITPPFSPVFGGGGGGGGLGEQPQDQAPIVEEPKKDNSWLWILAIVGGLYFLTKKKN